MGCRITFVVPHLAFSGGQKIVLTYAEGLADRGHEVTLVHGQLPSLKARIANRFFPGSGHERRPAPNVRLVSAPGKLSDIGRYLPDADALVATWWETVEAVKDAPESKGRKFHLVQGHEVWSYLPARSADVYRLPFHKIAVSGWLLNLMRDTYGSSDASLVVNPVDVQRFDWIERRKGDVPTVGTLFSVTPVKNSALAFEAVRLAREHVPQLRLSCFGADDLPKNFIDLPYVSYVRRPSQERIPELYRSCDYWLFTSTEEGFGLPILEAMAVGTPVIATPAGAAPDLVSERTGALVGQDAREMAAAIVGLFGEPESAWEARSRACREIAEAHDVQSALSEFEAIVCGGR